MTAILFASLSLAFLALPAAWLLNRFRIKSPLIHRATWGIVLLQGIVFIGIPMPIPVLETAPSPPLANPAPVAGTLDSNAVPTLDSSPNETARDLDSGQESRTSNYPTMIYLSGCLLGLGYFAIAYIALLFSVRNAVAAPGHWQEQLKTLLGNRGIGPDSVSLLVHPRLGPLLCRLPSGYAIVLPQTEWNALTEAQREAVLDHEIAHIERRDIWKTLAMRLLALIHWFNPVAWWVTRQFEEAAEWDCDRRLTDRGKQNAINYARALLTFAEPRKPLPVGASLARGAALSPRIDRLTSGIHKTKDSGIQRFLFIFALTCFAIVSLLRFELVARESDEGNDQEEDYAAFADSLDTYTKRINGSGDVLENFKNTIAARPGKIVLKDLVAELGQETRERKIATAIPDHIAQYYDSKDGTLALKPENLDLKEKLLKANHSYQKDIAGIQSAMKEIRESLANKSEADELLTRFLGQKDAAYLLYMEGVQKQMNPGKNLIQDRLGSVFVSGKNGKLTIPPSRAEKAQTIIQKGQQVIELAEKLSAELPAFAQEIATPDEAHESCKRIIKEPGFASYVASESAKDLGERPVAIAVDMIFANIESGFVDKADGLHIDPKKRSEMDRVLSRYQMISANLGPVSESLAQYASRIEEKDELHRSVKEVLMTPAAAILFARELEGDQSDAGYVFKKLVSAVLESDRGGKMRVQKDKQEEVVAKMRDALKGLRNLGRKQRQLGEFAGNFEDKDLEKIYHSPIGTLIVLQMIRREIEMMETDGLELWFAKHFEEDEAGQLQPRAQSMDLLSEINLKAKEISENLKSDL